MTKISFFKSLLAIAALTASTLSTAKVFPGTDLCEISPYWKPCISVPGDPCLDEVEWLKRFPRCFPWRLVA